VRDIRPLAIAGLSALVLSCHVARPAPVPRAEAEPPSVGAVATALAASGSDLDAAARRRVGTVLLEEAERFGLDPRLVLAVIHVESRGRTRSVSRAGALGLMQLRPRTAEEVARRSGLPWRGPEALFDPELNVRLGVRYLAALVERYGSIPTALVAYNWGPTRISARLRRGEPLPVAYARRVFRAWQGPGGIS